MSMLENLLHSASQTTYNVRVCTPDVLETLIDQDLFQQYLLARKGDARISIEVADAIASALKKWASSQGVRHYCHWFQPWTFASAEKHDAFFEWGKSGMLIEKFTGSSLIMGEPDASSFPSGGLRNTYEARGYTSWDPSSSPFIWKTKNASVLCIPSIFFSYNGEALDTKIPLHRAEAKLSSSVKRLLELLGNSVDAAWSTLGCEQEYFLLEERISSRRIDLLLHSATVVGAPPAKGQELEDHYFGSLKPRVLAFMDELEKEALALGIPVKTRHNEVAPAQHEIAPLYENVIDAVDHNILLMQLMKTVAKEHGLHCILHEKPFAGINGSGKHLNWSIATSTGENLFDPGDTPETTMRFLVFLAAVLEAIHTHTPLLRASIGSYSNDKRLGGHEAPPAIISVYLGEGLEWLIAQICQKTAPTKGAQKKVDLGLLRMPELGKHDTDRNRTSPFAFTGNKFEFRACGSSHSPAFPSAVLSTIVAEALEMLADKIEGGTPLLDLLAESFEKTKRVRFMGDNYAEAWHEEAKLRGLDAPASSLEAFSAILSPSTAKAFEDVLSERELESVYEVFCDAYTKNRNIEKKLLIEIAETLILPVAFRHQQEYALSIKEAESICGDAMPIQKKILRRYSTLLAKIIESLEILKKETDSWESIAELRELLDELETTTDAAAWPMPRYSELLFKV